MISKVFDGESINAVFNYTKHVPFSDWMKRVIFIVFLRKEGAEKCFCWQKIISFGWVQIILVLFLFNAILKNKHKNIKQQAPKKWWKEEENV